MCGHHPGPGDGPAGAEKISAGRMRVIGGKDGVAAVPLQHRREMLEGSDV